MSQLLYLDGMSSMLYYCMAFCQTGSLSSTYVTTRSIGKFILLFFSGFNANRLYVVHVCMFFAKMSRMLLNASKMLMHRLSDFTDNYVGEASIFEH